MFSVFVFLNYKSYVICSGRAKIFNLGGSVYKYQIYRIYQ